MAASVTTKIPTDTISRWCSQNLYSGFPRAPALPDVAHCANATKGEEDSDFLSICCDGDIIDRSQKLFNPGGKVSPVDLSNLVCCRDNTPLPGGIMPINTKQQECTEGNPTPLATLAATNTANAQIYPVTFISASGEPPNLGNFTFTQTPKCMWLYTGNSSAALSEITLPPAMITTLPVGWPDSSDPLIYSVPTTTQVQYPVSTSDGWVAFKFSTFGISRSGLSQYLIPLSTSSSTTSDASATAVGSGAASSGPITSAPSSSRQEATSTATNAATSSSNSEYRRSWGLMLFQGLLAAALLK